jgi:DNA/RNA endonuclease YhcR with UshA esterase domain
MASKLMPWIRKNALLSGAIVIAMFGLIVLSLGAGAAQPSPTSIAAIYSVKEGAFVSFLGVVRSVSPRDSGYSVAVCDSNIGKNCVSVLMSRSIIPPTLVPGDYVTIRGFLRMYLGRMFVVPSQSADVTVVNQPSR